MTTVTEVKEALESAKEEAKKQGRTWLSSDEILRLRHLLWFLTEPLPWELAVDLGHSGAVRYWSEINHPKVLPPVEALAAPGKDDTDTIRLLRAGAHLFESSMSSIIDPYQFQFEDDRAAWNGLDGAYFNSVVVYRLRGLLLDEDNNTYNNSRSEPDWNLRLPYGPDYDLYYKMAPRKSLEDPNRISYRDITDVDPRHRIVTTPGRFLTKFFSHIFDKPRIAALAAAFNAGDGELKFARSEEEIIKVYRNGPNSCMSHGITSYHGDKHPVAVYASPDLGVAYLERGGDITARALVRYNKEGKPYIHSRIYGDYTRISRFLTAAGISPDEDNHGFSGARLVKIPYNNTYIMPYVDNYDVDRGTSEFFKMALDEWGDYRAKETCGLLEEDNTVWSDIEDRYIDADEAISWRGEYISPEYAEENLTWSERGGEYIHNDDIVEVNFKCLWSSSGYTSDCVGTYWRDRYAFHCDKTDEWWAEDDFEPIEIESTGETWSDWAVEEYGNPDDIEEASDEGGSSDDLPVGVRKAVNDILSGKADGLRECVVAYMEKAQKDYVCHTSWHSRVNIGDIVFSEYAPGNCHHAIVADFSESRNEIVLFFPKDGRCGHIGNNRGLFAGVTPGHWFCSLNRNVAVVIPVMHIPSVYEELKKAEAAKDESLLAAIAA